MLTGAEVRTALGLRSTWFSVGVLALDPLPATTLQYGTPFTLTGLGRALPDLRLEQRAPGTAEWVVNRDVETDDDGSFSVARQGGGARGVPRHERDDCHAVHEGSSSRRAWR